jgi:hypothetical protein
MISEREIWEIAVALVEHHGERAPSYAESRLEEALTRNETAAPQTCLWVTAATEEWLRTQPAPGERRH